jgi:hypothetical protein
MPAGMLVGWNKREVFDPYEGTLFWASDNTEGRLGNTETIIVQIADSRCEP